MSFNKRIACWFSEKKSQKINWDEFENMCQSYGFQLFKLDLNKTLESQHPFHVLLHKLTDIIASANEGDIKSINIIKDVEKYIANNPEVIVIDPIPNVRKLLDRYISYSIIHSTDLCKYGVFTPNFCELTSDETDTLSMKLRKENIIYPFICKPLVGHGSRQAHEMSIIFNEKSLIDCKTPCVAQSFVNHNAVLYKIFIVGDKHYLIERPSLKNFYSYDLETIHFDSSDISKAGSQSMLTILDPDDIICDQIQPDASVIEIIASTLRKAFGMDLLGVDVVIEKSSGKYAIIDVNAYPGYDGFPKFFGALLDTITRKMESVVNGSNFH